MRIAHVITRLIIGGAQENTILTCEGLARKGHEVTLIAGPETGPEGSLWSEAERSGSALIRLDALRRHPDPIRDWRCLRALTEIFRDGGFDVVHTHSSKAGILGRMAARRAGTPSIVHTIHGMSFNRTQGVAWRWFYRTLERYVAPVTDAFVSVAEAMTDQAVLGGLAPRGRFSTIRSGMRVDRFVPDDAGRRVVQSEWGVSEDDIVVGTISRLFRNKGYEELIDVLATVASKDRRIRYVWVGDGLDRGAYESRLEALGLRDRVTLVGLAPPEDIPRLISGFDILAHASRWEGLPRAVVQGLLMERPAVGFDLDGTREVIVDGETGFLAPYPDVEAFAECLLRLSGDADRRRAMGAVGRRRCVEAFSAERMVDAIEALYVGLRERRSSD
jgi:glycosyltransferase involved in cell wall biosynthesis